MAGIYIHIPFCAKLCSYCDFHFSVSMHDKDRMIEAIAKEILLRENELRGADIQTLYIGGGTPTVCSISQLSNIINAVKNIVDLSKLKEFTIECNPEDLTKEYLAGLKSLGITRLSIGIQSFDDDILRFFNRRHDSSRAKTAVKDAKDIGFDNITIDLIYGVDGFAEEAWHKSVTEALKLGVQHISAYHLTIDKGSVLGYKLGKGEIKLIDEDLSQSQFDYIHSTLTDAGFEHYEVSNYATQGYRAVHNSNYWKGLEYFGFGASAHSYNGKQRFWNISNNRKYIEQIEANTLPVQSEDLTLTDNYNEYVMISLRTSDGVDLQHILQKFGKDYYNYFLTSAEQFLKSGLLVAQDNTIKIPSEDFLVSDSVITELFYEK